MTTITRTRMDQVRAERIAAAQGNEREADLLLRSTTPSCANRFRAASLLALAASQRSELGDEAEGRRLADRACDVLAEGRS